MKILVISGFLGAGKTTFIKMLAEKTKRDFVVLENEYGQADIDGAVLREGGNLNIYELTEGCVCCTMKQDFAASILTIANTLDPEYLVIEPTGVAKLSNILFNIQQIQYERIVLLKPITILDGSAFDEYLSAYGDDYADQLDASFKIVITKMEQADAAELQRLERSIRSRNEDAELVLSHYSSQPKEWWDSLLSDFLDPAQAPKIRSEEFPEMETLSLTAIFLDTPPKLIAFLEAVVFGVFGKIVRAKGFLPCGQAVLRFDVVNRTYAVTGMDSKTGEKPSCVFIGSDLRRSWLREILQPAFRMRGLRRVSSRKRPG
jgi:G3E family GTPase